MVIEQGRAIPPQTPGLGIDWDWAAIEKRAVYRQTITA
jgi:L-alanine-DL-glutamate epimerase-like enolase superfamily enzyme